MTLDRIWVFGEAGADGVATITLEMLAKAREVAGTVEVFLGSDGAAGAAELGDHGAARVYSTGDLGGRMQGVSVASAVAAAIASGDVAAPDAFLLGTTYDGRDVARPALGEARGQRAVERGRPAHRRRPPSRGGAGVRRHDQRRLPVHRRRTRHLAGAPEVVRTLSGGRTTGGGGGSAGARTGRGRRRGGAGPLHRGVRGTQAGRGRHRGLRRAGARLRGGLLDDREAGQGARRRAGSQPSHRRRGLGALQLPGRPDRQGGQTDRLHRLRHLRRDPAPSWA